VNKGLSILVLSCGILSSGAMCRSLDRVRETLSNENLCSKSDEELRSVVSKGADELYALRPIITAYLASVRELARSCDQRIVRLLGRAVPSQVFKEGKLKDFCNQAGIAPDGMLVFVRERHPDFVEDAFKCFVGSPK